MMSIRHHGECQYALHIRQNLRAVKIEIIRWSTIAIVLAPEYKVGVYMQQYTHHHVPIKQRGTCQMKSAVVPTF